MDRMSQSHRPPRAARGLFAAALASIVACACTTTAPRPEDPIVVPEDARQVDHIDFFGRERRWTRINTHMLVAWAGPTPYLLVFEQSCPRIMSRSAIAISRSHEDALRAPADAIVVEGMPCQIDRIYAVTQDDVTSLSRELRHP